MAQPIKIGIIGGTGMESDFNLMTNIGKTQLKSTPFGSPSQDEATTGEIAGVQVVVVGRHGPGHTISPSKVNYRANLLSLQWEGCTHILATTACGSLKEEIKPGTFAVLDQYINRTYRPNSFYRVCHVPQSAPYDRQLQQILVDSCKELNFPVYEKATAVCIEGPSFSTLAESKLYRSWNCDLVNMTTVPETQLATEIGLVYASLALVTDYDCWHEDENETVNVALVTERLLELKRKASLILENAVKKCSTIDWSETIKKKKELCEVATMAK